MKGLRISLVASVAVHLLLLTLLFHIRGDNTPPKRTIAFILTTKTPEVLPQKKVSSSTLKPSKDQAHIHKIATPPIYEKPNPPSHPLNDLNWKAFVQKNEKKQLLLSEQPSFSPQKKTQQQRNPRLVQIPETMKNLPPPRDDVAEQVQKWINGTIYAMAPVQAPAPKEIKTTPHFDFLPTEAQIDALNIIYKKGKATQMDIYALLSTDQPITAEGFDQELEELVNKEFLTKKKISPENTFTIASPFFVLPIEMSKTNRLNPVYLFKPNVDKNKIMTYLQARLFLLQENLRSSPTDSAILNPQIQSLHKKIQILLQ